MTIFEKIIRREIPAKIVHEDDDLLAFHDANPQAPVHVLIVSKRVIPRLAEATAADEVLLGKLLLAAKKIASDLGLTNGYRVVINSGVDAGESVPHLHVHLLGRRVLAWPPGYIRYLDAITESLHSQKLSAAAIRAATTLTQSGMWCLPTITCACVTNLQTCPKANSPKRRLATRSPRICTFILELQIC